MIPAYLSKIKTNKSDILWDLPATWNILVN